MADDEVKPQPQQNPQDTGARPVGRPPADPDLSDHYQRDPSPGAIEKRRGLKGELS